VLKRCSEISITVIIFTRADVFCEEQKYKVNISADEQVYEAAHNIIKRLSL